MAQKKYSLGMDEELMKRIEKYATGLHITRNAAISVLISQALDAQKAIGALDDFMQAYKLESAKKTLDASEHK